ncbi:MAG: hypothetical protein GY705_31785 [Bacteroidetes bacterium]|nr:hypothetical protein [Bacteroidota bacterium]
MADPKEPMGVELDRGGKPVIANWKPIFLRNLHWQVPVVIILPTYIYFHYLTQIYNYFSIPVLLSILFLLPLIGLTGRSLFRLAQVRMQPKRRLQLSILSSVIIMISIAFIISLATDHSLYIYATTQLKQGKRPPRPISTKDMQEDFIRQPGGVATLSKSRPNVTPPDQYSMNTNLPSLITFKIIPYADVKIEQQGRVISRFSTHYKTMKLQSGNYDFSFSNSSRRITRIISIDSYKYRNHSIMVDMNAGQFSINYGYYYEN